MRQRLWALTLALAVAGCQTPIKVGKAISSARVQPPTTPGLVDAGLGAGGTKLISDQGAGLISDQGAGLISDNGGSLIGSLQIPAGVISNNAGSLISDGGGAIISNNAGALVSNNAGSLVSNNAGSIISNHAGGYHTLALEAKPGAGFTVTIVDAALKPLLDPANKPYQTMTSKDGSYSFKTTPRGRHLLVRIDLPKAVGPMFAFLPDATAGAGRTADVNAASTLVMGYILDKLLVGQADPTVSLQKLPADVEATTRAKAATALGDGAKLTSFLPGAVVPTVESLAKSDLAFGAQVEVVKKILIAGLSDVGEGQLATKVGIASPRDVLRLSDGSFLIAERNGNRIRRVDLRGIMTTFAGKDGASDVADNGPAVDAFVDRPYAMAIDSQGNVYICDFGHHELRRVDAKTHLITRVAGNGTKSMAPPATNDQPAATTAIRFPVTVVVDKQDRPCFATSDGVFRIEANGALHQLGFPGVQMPQSLAATPDGRIYAYENQASQLFLLTGEAFVPTQDKPQPVDSSATICSAPDGTLYLESSDKIFKLAAGAWQPVPIGSPHGGLEHLSVGSSDILLTDAGLNRIWRMPIEGGTLTPVAGLDISETDALTADQLSLNRPTSLAMLSPGHLLVADGLTGVVWERRPDNLYYRFAGGRPALPDDTDIGDGGPARDAKVLKVAGMKRLHDGTVLLTEAEPPTVRVRAVSPTGLISTRKLPDNLQVPALFGELPDGSLLVGDYFQHMLFHWVGDTATQAIKATKLAQPAGIAVQPDGGYYLADTDAHAIYHVANDAATLVAGGNGKGFGGDGGPATAAQLNQPLDLTVGPDHKLYFSDAANDRVRRIDLATGTIQTCVGAGGVAYGGATSDDSLKQPAGLVFDANGDLYVADSGHNQVKLVEASKLK